MKKKILAFLIVLLCFASPSAAYAQSYNTKADVLKAIRTNLIQRDSEFTLEATAAAMNEIGQTNDLYDLVIAYDSSKSFKDGDYLKFSINQWNYLQTSYSEDGKNVNNVLEFRLDYSTTADQEKAVNAKIKSVITSLNLEDASDYKKVKAIHKYIIKRADYDQTLTKSTAYDLLIDKTAVCQGYALAAYRLFSAAGIECRIISGKGNGVPHAWNIVKVNDLWYNIDVTWDDPTMSDGTSTLSYDYFLKSEEDFTGHTRDAEYRTQKFKTKYPISASSYSTASK
ncbi:MAG: transglutaminase domain-containing protein [Mobilitalea sp.]